MPILDHQDARAVDRLYEHFFKAQPDARAQALRTLFAEVLDFPAAFGHVSLRGASSGANLPDSAERIAELDGVDVCYVALEIDGTDRVRKAEAVAAILKIEEQLGPDMLVCFSNTSVSQLHLIHPHFTTARPCDAS